MIYQLPNGKVIHLTVEEFLDLTDQDIQYLMSVNAGNHAASPWHGSAIKGKKQKPSEEEEEEDDRSIDYFPDLEEPLHGGTPEEEIPDEEFRDFSDMTPTL